MEGVEKGGGTWGVSDIRDLSDHFTGVRFEHKDRRNHLVRGPRVGDGLHNPGEPPLNLSPGEVGGG